MWVSQPQALRSRAVIGEEDGGSEKDHETVNDAGTHFPLLEHPKSLLSMAFIDGFTHSGSSCSAPGVRQSQALRTKENIH